MAYVNELTTTTSNCNMNKYTMKFRKTPNSNNKYDNLQKREGKISQPPGRKGLTKKERTIKDINKEIVHTYI